MSAEKGMHPLRRRLLDYQVLLVIILILILVIVNMVYFFYRYLFNVTIQYVFLALIFLAMSFSILVKALEAIEWRKVPQEEYRGEGQLSRMVRRVSLASRGFPFTQDLLRKRVECIFRQEGVAPDSDTAVFLETHIEGRGPSRRRGERYMTAFMKALSALEENL